MVSDAVDFPVPMETAMRGFPESSCATPHRLEQRVEPIQGLARGGRHQLGIAGAIASFDQSDSGHGLQSRATPVAAYARFLTAADTR